MHGRPLVLIASAILALALACTKSESETSSPPVEKATPSSATSAPALPSASTVASAAPPASAAPTETPPASATAAAHADAPKKTDAGGPSATATAAASGAIPECGIKPLPDCPLQAWMKSNANPPVMTSNLPGLATALEKIVALAPPGYPNWASIAKDGAAAAKSGDLTAAKASCRSCHDQYKLKYKTEIRGRKI
jgi:hypothetical protein